MTASLAGAAGSFVDFGSLAALRREAIQDTPEARRAVARQFEALFMSLVLDNMRGAAAVPGALFDGAGMRLYQDLHDRQLALALAEGPGLGLADAVLRQLGESPARRPVPGALTDRLALPRLASAPPLAVGGADRAGVDASSPEAFVAALWPHARRAAAQLGTSPEVLVAQAALETGWGRRVLAGRSGEPTFNVFGIKAGGSWTGPRVAVTTVEYVDGVAERRTEPFRVYASLAEAFDDYVALVRGLPRYRAALEAASPEDYVRSLAAGGYSTDPRYAEKVLAVLERLPAAPQAEALAADSDSGGLNELRHEAGGGES
ncbi:MAG TPA: flagellar assembly peptidoglycan hydrolase FlgJ [Gammaproteobacteria bacterium]